MNKRTLAGAAALTLATGALAGPTEGRLAIADRTLRGVEFTEAAPAQTFRISVGFGVRVHLVTDRAGTPDRDLLDFSLTLPF